MSRSNRIDAATESTATVAYGTIACRTPVTSNGAIGYQSDVRSRKRSRAEAASHPFSALGPGRRRSQTPSSDVSRQGAASENQRGRAHAEDGSASALSSGPGGDANRLE